MPLISCKINLILIWSADNIFSSATGATKFKVSDTKLYVSIVTFSTQNNGKLLQKLKSGFKRLIRWYKYQPKLTIQT